MSNTERFKWSDKAKLDLLSIYNTATKNNDVKWSNIAIEFKELYPTYKGMVGSLRKMCSKFKNEKINLTTREIVEPGHEKFRWFDKENTDLLSIVNSHLGSKMPYWSAVLTEFKHLHPNFEGNDKTLQKQYTRLSKKK